MGFLDIRGLSPRQKSGGKGWNPANGVPFCARAYICRPRPLGPLGAILKEGSTSGEQLRDQGAQRAANLTTKRLGDGTSVSKGRRRRPAAR